MTDYLIGTDQGIPDWPVKSFLGEINIIYVDTIFSKVVSEFFQCYGNFSGI